MDVSTRGLANKIVQRHEASVGAEGATLNADTSRAAVHIPAGALSRPAQVSLAVAQRQFGDVLRDHYAFSPHGTHLSVEPDTLTGNGELAIELPFQGAYDPFNTMLAVKNQAGKVMAIPAHLGPSGTTLVGHLDKQRFDVMAQGTAAGGVELKAFTANRMAPTLPPVLTAAVYQWTGGQFTRPVGDLSGKRVALCVHGINSSLDDIHDLGAFLAGYAAPGGGAYYDAVIGFQYSSNVPLNLIGTAMAQQVYPAIAPATAVDLFAHSMGNLVSRYALETPSLPERLGPKVGHYVSLAGPHAGVPFGDLNLLQTIAFLLPIECLPCLRDMLTVGANGKPETPFLSALNTKSNGPDRATAHYFSAAGSDYQDYDGVIGDTLHGLYIAADLSQPADWADDGLVAVYTAQSDVLAFQSASWAAGPTLPLNHHEFVTDQQSFDYIAGLINNW